MYKKTQNKIVFLQKSGEVQQHFFSKDFFSKGGSSEGIL